MNKINIALLAVQTLTLACQGSKPNKGSSDPNATVRYKAGSVVTLEAKDDQSLSLYLGQTSDICSDTAFYNADGEEVQGTRNCAAVRSDPNLIPENIKDGVSIADVHGKALVVPSTSDLAKLAAEDLPAGVSLGDIRGTLDLCTTNGSQNCVASGAFHAAANCSSNSSNCYLPPYAPASQPLKAISYDAINAGKTAMRSSLSLAGVNGTLIDCASNGATACVANATYQAADFTNLSAGNIKRGVAIAGVTGTFPSAASPLPRYTDSGVTNTTAGSDIADLTNFASQLTTNVSFEYWDSSGVRRTGSGDSDFTAANVKNSLALENLSLTGSYSTGFVDCTSDAETGCITTSRFRPADPSTFTSWDIRAGLSIAGVAGGLVFYKSMAITSFRDRTTGPGAAAGIDFYDSLDDFVKGDATFPSQAPAGWAQPTGANWTEVSLNSVYKDELTGLYWGRSDATQSNWEQAITNCEAATTGSRSDWRLPTFRELIQAYIDGIFSKRTNLNIDGSPIAAYWTSTTDASNPAFAMAFQLGPGTLFQAASSKSIAYSQTLCVAP